MKICFVLNDIETEKCETSVIIIKKAYERGHDIYLMGVGDFVFYNSEGLKLRCKKIPGSIKEESPQGFLQEVQADTTEKEIRDCREMDILFLRNNPTQENDTHQWAKHTGISFGRMAKRSGVLVLNDPVGLSQAFIDKLYFEELPPAIKPKSLITRNREELLKFWEENGQQMVLKPLEGSRGQDVYKITEEKQNINQILDTLSGQGYIIAQEYIPETRKGDNRVLMLNGKILEQDGEKAIIHRLNKDESEFRNNLALGATATKGRFTPEIEHIVSIAGPKLIEDGLFFAGLDIVKNKLIEINAMSPGDMHEYKSAGMCDFTDSIVDALERKVDYKKQHKNITNGALATMP